MALPLQLTKLSQASQCLVCSKPLGHDTKLSGIPFCHDHAQCSICSQDLFAYDAHWLLKKFTEGMTEEELASLDYSALEIYHVKCAPLPSKNHTISQADFDYLNILRLTFKPNTDTSLETNEKEAALGMQHLVQDMSFEEISLELARMSSAIEVLYRLKSTHKDYKQKFLDDRERERFQQAKQAQVKKPPKSSQQASQQENSTREERLQRFTELHYNPGNAPSPEIVKGHMKNMNKAVPGLMAALGLSQQDAEAFWIKNAILGKSIDK